ncbi:MAG TPA: YDG domain-containing protein [Verrucomicrobiae bacterium]|nr:YDG domain-containing protein [Verrucomicrobiae bacterium]
MAIIIFSLLRKLLGKRWLHSGLICVLLTGSGEDSYGQITNLANITISVNTGNTIRTADTRWFGINASVYDPDLNIQDGIPEINKAGWQTLRFPGGSIADTYHWAQNNVSRNNTYANFAKVATNMGATVILTVNYGSGTAAEAAAWVADANVTNHYGFKYWEVGNEEYGTYETDNHARPHDPYTYATNFAAYIQQMKAIDPTIKVGVVLDLNPTADSNGYTDHPATNLVTGQIFYGWTPVVLSTLRQLGVTPDFGIHHWYPENSPTPENDQTLLAGTGSIVANASTLRGEITQYFGSGGTNIELLVTENNSYSGTQGKQSVSLVNGLYYADNLGQLMKTEFNALVWWDYTDSGPGTSGNLSSSLYGWRMYGDFGVMMTGAAEPLTNRYPQYFAAELMSHFIRAGDTVLNASSSNPLVSAYAAQRTNGSLTLLAINKSLVTNYPVSISLANYTPLETATLYSYGMPQDNAAKAGNNLGCDVAQTNISGVSTNFTYILAPYSMTIFAFMPATSFLGLNNRTITYGTSSVTLTGILTTNGTYPPSGTVVAATINGNAQNTTTYDSTGDFTLNYNTTGLSASATPYTVTYLSAANGGFPAETNAATTLTINPLPVVLTGTRFYDETATATAAILSVSNLVGSDDVILSGSVGLAGVAIGPEAITDFSGLTLSGVAATNYTLVGASGTVTVAAYPTPQFSGLINQSIAYGSPSVILTGTLGTNGAYPPSGTVITVTINFSPQTTTIYDSTGDFIINYNTVGLPAFPFSVAYSSVAGGGFSAATNANTTLTVNPVPVILTGTRAYDGTATAAAAILSVANLVGNDNVTLTGNVGLAGTGVGTQVITDFSGLTLAGAAMWDYTLIGASGTVTITAGGITLGDISVDGAQFIFNYPTIIGQTYQVEYCTNLSSGVWFPVGDPVTGTGAPVSVTNSIDSSAQKFFRLSITP